MTFPQPPVPGDFIAIPAWPLLRVFGPDAATWLQGIVTCDVLSVKPGRASWGSLLTKVGKFQADLQIVGQANDLFIALSGGDVEATLKTLDGFLVMEDAELETSPLRVLIIRGDVAKTHVESRGLVAHLLPWGGGETYLTLFTPDEQSSIETSFSGEILSSSTWARFLVEVGFPVFGIDYLPSDNPHDATLERRTVDWQKGCYLGQEVVCMQDMRGKVKRRLVRIEVVEGPDLAPGIELRRDGEVRGRVTSSAGNRAIGTVKAPDFEPGTILDAGPGRVRVQALP